MDEYVFETSDGKHLIMKSSTSVGFLKTTITPKIPPNTKTEAIYFVDGIRLLPLEYESYTIEDLIKLSNGAKHVYLFSFKIPKEKINITLPDALDPLEAIKTWKKEHNLSNYGGATRSYEGELGLTEYTTKYNHIENDFETEDKIYHITCENSKQKAKIIEDYVRALHYYLY
ncbi:Conserved hypothetical protein [Candidatus Phytoplasma australiense]|uniref:Uncharacterized protein n=1 Tax=Phytoplasma australiense TaxID=59748 RepID=B1V9J6_PHYAS|nr:Conserved hypothetical protein [Candidatus Phytoplasma australiense]